MDTHKKKIAICIFHPWNLTSWFDTKLIEELSEIAEVTFISTQEIIDTVKSTYKIQFKLDLKAVKLEKPKLISRAFFFTSLIVNRKKNTSFNYRIKWLIFGEIKLFPRNTRKLLISVQSNFKHLVKYIKNYFYQLPIFIPILNKLILSLLSELYQISRCELPNEFKLNYDLIIFVSAAEEIDIFEIMKELKRIRIKTMICIENWDNLTSKRYMINHPDYVLVMGNSTADLATRIHNLPRNQIVSAGLPRFNVYRNLPKLLKTKSDKKFRILYLGFYPPHNEIELLNKLQFRLMLSKVSNNFKIIYKPHPGSRIRYLDDKNINEEIEVISSEERKNPFIDQSHLSLIQNADIVISTPTSMVIESMLLGKKVIMDLTDDGLHRTTARLFYQTHVHFRELDQISNLEKCWTLKQLENSIISEYVSPSQDFIKYDINNLIENKAKSYSSHIANLLN